MFIELTVSGNALDRSALGYLLGKHPTSTFERALTNGRTVRGRWVAGKETTFAITVDVSSRKFIETLRQLNFGNYIHAQQNVVCPFTLAGLREALSSVLHQKYHKGSTRHNDLFACECTVGPWQCSTEYAQKLFLAFAIEVTLVRPYVFRLVAKHDMLVSEFVQKLYVISNLLSQNLHIGDYNEWEDKLNAFVALASQWPEKKCDDDAAAIPQNLPRFVLKALGYDSILPFSTSASASSSTTSTSTQDDAKGKDDDDGDEKEGKEEKEEEGEEDAKEAQGDAESENKIAGQKFAHEAGDSEVVVAGLRSLSLHERRHALISDWLVASQLPENAVYIDYGCSNGTLTYALANVFPSGKFYAVDANEAIFQRQQRRRTKTARNVVKLRDNLLFPRQLIANLAKNSTSKTVDALILSEVIEHLEEKGRQRLIDVIAYLLRPQRVAITTPNRAYNTNIRNLCANGMRHWDHRIEYDMADWKREVVDPMTEAGYEMDTVAPLVPNVAEKEQPSFCGFFVLKKDAAKQEKSETVAESIRNMFTAFPLQHVQNATVNAATIAAGVVDRAFLAAADDAFFYGPTIAPVEHTEKEPDFLEHPRAAFDYYRERGAKKLMAERKYMGSRAHVLVFRDRRAADEFGWPAHKPLMLIISRSGRAFFTASGCAVASPPPAWQTFLQSRLSAIGRAYAVLDGEILPWTLKAGKMIEREFRRPGEYALATRAYTFGESSDEAKRAQLYLDALQHYETATVATEAAATEATTVTTAKKAGASVVLRVFNVLAACRGFRGDLVHENERYAMIDALCAGGAECGVMPVERFGVDLDSETSMQHCIDEWTTYCAQGGEGFVLKASPSLFQRIADSNTAAKEADSSTAAKEPKSDEEQMHKTLYKGGMLQPMLKVRGRDYLRLIYGMDYLTPDCFALVKKRRVSNKRLHALKQWEIGNRLLEAFLCNDDAMRLKCFAAICGDDAETVVDATL